MAVETYMGDSSGKARRITKLYAGSSGGTALELSKLYMGDSSGKAQLIFQKEEPVPLPIGYTQLRYIYNPNGAYFGDIGLNRNALYKCRLEMRLSLTGAKTGYMIGNYYSYDRPVSNYRDSRIDDLERRAGT